MKILLFTEIYSAGGIDTFIVNLINYWPNAEDEFVIIANSDYPGLRVIEKKLKRPCEICRHKYIGFPSLFINKPLLTKIKRVLSPLLRYLYIFSLIFLLRKILLSKKADKLIVINGGYPGGESCRAASISWGMFSGKLHSIHNYHQLVVKPVWHSFFQEWIVDSLVSRYTNKFITVSKAAETSMALRSAIPNMKKYYIHNGLGDYVVSSKNKINIKSEIGVPESAPLCLMLATYEPRKGHAFLLNSFVRVLRVVPSAHLLICGHGTIAEIDSVKKLQQELGLKKNVHLMGFRDDATSLIAGSDLLVVPSQEYESFGYTSVEAMANKVPVIATNIGGIPEVVVNGYGGQCLDSRDVELFAQYIIQYLEDGALRLRQGELGFKRYKQFFTADLMASRYKKFVYE